MEAKIISSSSRGLCFTFNHRNITIGRHIAYVIAAKAKKIFILPSVKGNRNTVSRKSFKNKNKSLIDLRSKNIRNFTSSADKMVINCNKHSITVESIKKQKEIYSTRKIEGPIRVASVFSGCGMLDYPFSLDNDFKLVFASDFMEDMCSSYRENIGDHVVRADIHDLNAEDIPYADVILGGPVCKAFSNANRSKTRLKDHKGSELIYEYIRLINDGDYKVFVIENVPELITACGGEFYRAVLECLSGFSIRHKVMQDCQYGGYTIRKRVFIIGSKIGVPKFLLPKITDENNYRTSGDALSLVDESWFNYSDVCKSSQEVINKMSYVSQGGNYKDIPEHLRGKGVHSSSYKRLDPLKPSITITNFRKTMLIHPVHNRIISVAEGLTLQGFVHPFKVLGSMSNRVEQVGNGVPFALGNAIRKTVKRLFK